MRRGAGSRGPGELPPAGEGGKGNPGGCASLPQEGSDLLWEGWERSRPRRDRLRLQPRGGRERRTYLRPDGRHAASSAERRGRAAAAALYLPGGRRAGPPRPPRLRGRGTLRAPPRLSQQRGPDGRSRAGLGRAEQNRVESSGAERRGCSLTARHGAGGRAAPARGTDSPKPAVGHGCRAGGVLGGGDASRRAGASSRPGSSRVTGCRRARSVFLPPGTVCDAAPVPSVGRRGSCPSPARSPGTP